jgi:hypothetical protein
MAEQSGFYTDLNDAQRFNKSPANVPPGPTAQ